MNEKEIEYVANYILANSLTIRGAGKTFGVPKSTIHYNVTKKLVKINYNLYLKLHAYLQRNFEEKHLRGGNATKLKYQKMNKNNKKYKK